MTEAITTITEANDTKTKIIQSSVNDKVIHNATEAHRQVINEQLAVLRRCIARTNSRGQSFFGNFKTMRNLLFERKFEESSLFETILSKTGMKEVIELVFEMSDTLKNEYILQTVRQKTGFNRS